jgi:hypothetical protein
MGVLIRIDPGACTATCDSPGVSDTGGGVGYAADAGA